MGRRFSFQSYQRTFAKPLRTARGEWSVREGFIVCVEDESGVGYGEIAPIPEFGSETVRQAEDFLWGLRGDPSWRGCVGAGGVACCAFGLSAALASGAIGDGAIMRSRRYSLRARGAVLAIN